MPTPPAAAAHLCQLATRHRLVDAQSLVLVAGCGSGAEARYIQHTLGIRMVACDIQQPGATWQTEGRLQFARADVTRLPFASQSFDGVFYHHVIEHVSSPEASLREIYRVLRTGGWMYIGTPNRHRLIGYLGSPDTTWKQKLSWNLADYKARLQGRFRNELGAHAGFTRKELQLLLSKQFDEVHCLTADYLQFKYGAKLPGPILRLITASWAMEFLAPAIYALCWKQGGS